MLRVEELTERLAALLAGPAARRRLASLTTRVEIEDPSAAVFASRLAGDRWFCWEEPDSGGFALAALGSARQVLSRGPGRFADVAAECAATIRARIAEEPEGLPAGAGPVWTGGFAFDPAGGHSSQWSSFAPAMLVLPELSLLRGGGETWLTVNALPGPGEAPERVIERLQRRLLALDRQASLPLRDPSPVAGRRIAGVTSPEAYERAVEAAVRRIRGGALEKVVLAREVSVSAHAAHDPAAVFGAMRQSFPSCFCFCVGTPEAAFLGASPELLIRRRGAGAATVALAGSTRRSADPAVDDHLGEQLLHSAKNREEHRIVARRIERALRPHAVWVAAEAEPTLIKVANIQHLATPVHAQLAEPMSAVELAGRLHPTPAVGAEPRRPGLEAIAELEAIDRGWYAGPVGWMDAAEDGEFCVALRSALLRDRVAHLYAGAGIVADSEPEAELAETELKLDAMLPLLSG